MASNTDRKTISLQVSKETYKEFNIAVIEKYGHTYGHIGESVDEALELWIQKQKREVK